MESGACGYLTMKADPCRTPIPLARFPIISSEAAHPKSTVDFYILYSSKYLPSHPHIPFIPLYHSLLHLELLTPPSRLYRLARLHCRYHLKIRLNLRAARSTTRPTSRLFLLRSIELNHSRPRLLSNLAIAQTERNLQFSKTLDLYPFCPSTEVD